VPRPLKALIEPFIERAKCYTLERGDRAIIVNCGGYENLKEMTKRLLKRRELTEALEQLDLRIAIAADRDVKPRESIRGLLASKGFRVAGGDAITVEFGGGAKLTIYVVEQGSGEATATGEMEDDLRRLVEALKPELQRFAEKVEEVYGPLTDKQKLLIYLALLEHKPRIRELYELVKEVLATANREVVERNLENLIRSLGKALE